MSEVQDTLPASSRQVIELSPFDFFATRRSALGGLGGHDGISDPNYAFHTHYQACAPGPITFTLRLEGLQAADGDLLLRVNVAPADFNGEVKLARTAQIPLTTLQARDGVVSLQVQARRGMAYAFLGHVHAEEPVQVSGVSITLDRLDHSATDADTVVEAEETRFGAESTRPVAMLIAEEKPSLFAPVSQVETAHQHRERDFVRWSHELGRGDGDPAWPAVFVARTLEAYGMLTPGARGLQFGEADGRIAAALERAGCDVGRVESPSSEPGTGHDFLYSIGACGRHESIAEAVGWIENGLGALNVGGLAVHCFRFRATLGPAGGAPGALVLSRSDVERLAFSLIANNHATAQFAYGPLARDRAFPEAWFGFIIRRGSL